MRDKTLFITFEGGEGSGKSSVAQNLKMVSEYNGRFEFFNDPSSEIPECILMREILLSKKYKLNKNAELLIYGAARAQLAPYIKASLNNGRHVICDRYYDSTSVYQGLLKGHGIEKIYSFNKNYCYNLVPDVTFLFDVNAKNGLARSNHRLEKDNIDESRWEEMGLKIHEKINMYYRFVASGNIERFIIIDSNKMDIMDMTKFVAEIIDEILAYEGNTDQYIDYHFRQKTLDILASYGIYV